jgi:hypothetical protein
MMNSRLSTVVLVSLAVVTAVGCSSTEHGRSLIGDSQEAMEQRWTYGDRLGVDGARMASQQMLLSKRTYAAVDMLFSRSQASVDKNQPMLVASLVSVHSLNETSPLGLIMSEQISGRSVQLGYRVHEIKLRNSISLKSQAGEFALSRELSALRNEHNAQAILSGTYAVGESLVHVNLKLTELTTSRVISSVDFVVPADRWQDRDIRSLVVNP